MEDEDEEAEDFACPESEPPVRLRINGMTGELMANVQLPPSAPIADVKRAILRSAGVPIGEQRLVPARGGAEPLADEQSVGEAAAGADTLDLTLVRVEGLLALSWGADRTLRLWDLAAGCAVHDFGGHVSSTQLRGVEVSWERGLALSWGGDKTMRIWDVHRGTRVQSLGGHSTEVLGVQVDWARSRALSWAADRALRLWDLQTGMYAELRGHSASVQGAALDWARNRALSWGADDIFLWDLEHGVALQVLQDVPGIRASSVHPDWSAALLAAQDSQLRLWPLGGPAGALPVAHDGARPCGAVDWATGRVLSWCASDRTLRLWSAGSALSRHVPGLYNAQVHWPSNLALTWSMDYRELRPQLWELGPEGERLEKRGEACGCAYGLVARVQAEIDWNRLVGVSWSEDAPLLRLWDFSLGTVRQELRGHVGEVSGLSVDWPRDRALSWSGSDTSLRLWDLSSGAQLHEMVREPCGAFGVLVDWGRGRALSWTEDSWGNAEFTIEFWELEHGTPVYVLSGHTDIVLGLTLAPVQDKSRGPSCRLLELDEKDMACWLRKINGPPEDVDASEPLAEAEDDALAAVADDPLLASYVAGELDDLVAQYRELLRSMPAGLAPQVLDGTGERASGEASPYSERYFPLEDPGSRVRLLMLGDAITMGAPYANSAPVPAAVAKMNAGVQVENAGWGGLLAMMLVRPQDFKSVNFEKLPLPTPGEYRCDVACVLVGSYDAVTLAGSDFVVEVQCVENRALDTGSRPVELPQDWKTRCPPSLELYERSLRETLRQLRAGGASVAVATPPPLGEELSRRKPADRLVARAPFLVGLDLARAVRRAAAAEGCAVLPLFECCVHRLRQLEKSGRTPIPWTPKRFWERMNFSFRHNINTRQDGFREIPWEDVSPDELRPALCHDLVKLNESGGAIWGALLQTWLDQQLGMREAMAARGSRG